MGGILDILEQNHFSNSESQRYPDAFHLDFDFFYQWLFLFLALAAEWNLSCISGRGLYEDGPV